MTAWFRVQLSDVTAPYILSKHLQLTAMRKSMASLSTNITIRVKEIVINIKIIIILCRVDTVKR